LGITPVNNNKVANPKNSAVSEHLAASYHFCDFDNFTILAHEQKKIHVIN